jgi:hypothetical protein
VGRPFRRHAVTQRRRAAVGVSDVVLLLSAHDGGQDSWPGAKVDPQVRQGCVAMGRDFGAGVRAVDLAPGWRWTLRGRSNLSHRVGRYLTCRVGEPAPGRFDAGRN